MNVLHIDITIIQIPHTVIYPVYIINLHLSTLYYSQDYLGPVTSSTRLPEYHIFHVATDMGPPQI